MRINKYLASRGIASRRKIDEMIERGLIKINGCLAKSGMDVSEEDEIVVDGKKIEKNSTQKVYFLLNKPVDVISSAKDEKGRKTVVDCIDCRERIFPIGRLDYGTSGLIILTNDGELFNRLIHPKSEVYKKYRVKIFGEIKDEEIKLLRNGVKLEDGVTLPAKVKLVKRISNKSDLIVEIREGRNRQIRRMFDFFGYRVLQLKRESIGKLGLGSLKMGEYRKLEADEIEYLYSL